MNINNPYFISLSAGLLVYILTKPNSKDGDKSERQTNLNYVFLTSLMTFIFMQYYSTNTTSLEPTLDCKFDE